ncbi:hypothetical protein I6N90_14540 [Paenibacillus sp. GSMTC-2017]|uniref:hypothetical protein n=1 Tax=Paenibacillus sp. GSMTC-2017 TaxID=2794350 RepID=UPI0018D5CDD0|nr:hypothetical protein [Paenibacillus sp. GSMTC-2017]MBH5319021.1 hypothetical protein [Paenibacillus sp. GSMTC-2017]
MNHYNSPGVGNHHGNGPVDGNSHRQGQNQLNHPNNGLHGSFRYDGDMSSPEVHISQTSASQSLLPAVVPHSSNQFGEIESVAPKKGFSLANLVSHANITEIKGFVDRMGGLDGILSTVTKVQKVVSSVTQIAPLVKVFMGSFGKKSSSSEESKNDWKPKRRKKRKPSAGNSRPRNGSGSRRRSQKPRR